jgi:tetratricopeptide (TPR) repeat protein
LGSCFHNLEQVQEGLAAFNEAAEVASAIGYERGTVHAMRGLAMQDAGLLQEAIQYHQEAITRSSAIGERRIEASNRIYLAGTLLRVGQLREALEHAEAVKQFSISSGDRYREQYARRRIARICLQLGEFGRAMEEGESALALARGFKDYEVVGYTAGDLAELYASMGDHETALRYDSEALAAIGRARTMPGKGSTLASIGVARLYRGDSAGARASFSGALASRFMLWGPPEGLWGLGMVSVREGQFDEARQHSEALEALARPRGMRTALAHALWVRAAAANAQGTKIELGDAITIAQECEEYPLLRALLTQVGSAEAQALTAKIAATIPDLRLRESYMRTPPL